MFCLRLLSDLDRMFCKKDGLISIIMGKEQVVDIEGGYVRDTL